MRKLVMKSLAALLALALLLTVLPATATTAKAATGDITGDGYVLFEETFDDREGGCLTYTSGTNDNYETFTISDLDIPQAQASRCYVGIKLELFVEEATNRSAYIQIYSAKNTSDTDIKNNLTSTVTPSGSGNAGWTFITTESATGVSYIPAGKGNIKSLTLRVGARRNPTSDTHCVKIDGFRVSLVLGELSGKEAGAQDIGRYLIAGTGYFQLQRDMTFNAYTDASSGDAVYDLIMGSNAVLDLNGYNLTIADGSSLKVPGNAKIVDTSANKIGKITCAEDALTITNSAHPTLPLRTADGYVFAEPSLIAGTHIFVDGEQTADAFTLHFRPGFGTLGGVNVRETYLAGGTSGIQMTANITSVDIYGNETKLQYEGSEDILLDDVFNGMYASQNARGKMTFQGFEKYQALKITLKLSADGATCTLPTYTVNNTKVTKHYASQFGTACATSAMSTTYNITAGGSTSVTDAGKLNLAGGTSSINLANAITTGEGKTLVMDFNTNVASTSVKAGFENRVGSTRYYLFATNGYSSSYNGILDMNPFTGERNIRLEINTETFAVTYYVDGDLKGTVTAAQEKLEGFISAWNGKTAINVSGTTTSNPLVLDNLLIYTIAS